MRKQAVLSRAGVALFATALLAACVGPVVPGAPQPLPRPVPSPSIPPVPPSDPRPPAPPGFRQPAIIDDAGLRSIVRADAARLQLLFGPPRLDVAEGDMRKLQFAGEACVLDIFLYPLAPGAEPVATWVEARRGSDGQAVDRAACARALEQGR